MFAIRTRCFATDVASEVAAAAAAVAEGPLSRFELHGYRPLPDLSDDATYMDIVMLITRSSQLRQGSMGCLLVRPAETTTFDAAEPDPGRNEPFGRIIAAAVNTSLFQPDASNVMDNYLCGTRTE